MLESGQFTVLETGTAPQGLDLLQRHPEIGLAIVDMVMPGMSGLDLAAEVNRRYPQIEILYITGYVASIAIQAIADHHPEAVLYKPFTQKQLISRVRKLLGMIAEAEEDPDPERARGETSWGRLIEGSDRVAQPYRIASYRNTSVAYSIAAAHAAVLRQAEIPYQFDDRDDPMLPFQLLAPADRWRAALDAISVLGLGADIAIAA